MEREGQGIPRSSAASIREIRNQRQRHRYADLAVACQKLKKYQGTRYLLQELVNTSRICRIMRLSASFWGCAPRRRHWSGGSTSGGNQKGMRNWSWAWRASLQPFFTDIEDRNRVFGNGPYIFNSAGLYLRFWMEKFNPDTEDFTRPPLWIRLYSLPQEYWDEEIL